MTTVSIYKTIPLPASRAAITLFDFTDRGIGFSAHFQENNRKVPVVEIASSPAEALRKLRRSPLVRESRRATWRNSALGIIRSIRGPLAKLP